MILFVKIYSIFGSEFNPKTKFMKRILFCFLVLTSFASKAQINVSFYADPDELKQLKTRPLLVEVLEEDEDVLKKLDKPKKADELADYKKFIVDFNKDFKIYAEKYWAFTDKIEFKTTSEIEALQKAKNKSYAVLRLVQLNDKGYWGFKTTQNVPAIAFTRIESNIIKTDSKIYLPSRNLNNENTLSESDYKYALTILQANVDWIIANNKVLNFDKYAEKMAKENVSKLKGKTLLVEDNMLAKGRTKEAAIKNYGGDLKFVSESELNDALVNKSKNTAVLYTAPYGIVKSNAPFVSMSTIVYFKIIVDCETNEILWLYMPGAMNWGANMSNQLTEGEFKVMADSKII
jgi:hypothetical protein